MNHKDTITIRRSTPADRAGIMRLGALDGRPAPAGEVLLGFVDGELHAAVPLAGGEALADPFRRTAELVDLLRLRASLERRITPPRRGRGLRVRPAFAAR
jgi:hypothetical protein